MTISKPLELDSTTCLSDRQLSVYLSSWIQTETMKIERAAPMPSTRASSAAKGNKGRVDEHKTQLKRVIYAQMK
jgi:hypothetical protein